MKYIRKLITIELFWLATKIDSKTHHEMMMEYAEKYINKIGGVFVGDIAIQHFKDEGKKIEDILKNNA